MSGDKLPRHAIIINGRIYIPTTEGVKEGNSGCRKCARAVHTRCRNIDGAICDAFLNEFGGDYRKLHFVKYKP